MNFHLLLLTKIIHKWHLSYMNYWSSIKLAKLFLYLRFDLVYIMALTDIQYAVTHAPRRILNTLVPKGLKIRFFDLPKVFLAVWTPRPSDLPTYACRRLKFLSDPGGPPQSKKGTPAPERRALPGVLISGAPTIVLQTRPASPLVPGGACSSSSRPAVEVLQLSDVASASGGPGSAPASGFYPLTTDALRSIEAIDYITEHLKQDEEYKQVRSFSR